MISNVANDTEPITISLWSQSLIETLRSRPSAGGGKGDAFLGLVTIPASTLLSHSSPSEIWYPLDKRSTRSHVSGDVLIRTCRVTESIWANNHSPFQTIPSQPRRYYVSLLRRLLDYDSKQKDGGSQLSPSSQAILNNVAMIWRLDDVSRSIA